MQYTHNISKKKSALFVMLTLAVIIISACGKIKKIAPKYWYEETLGFYRDGIKDDWKNAGDYYIPSEYTDKKNKLGYLLKDLDGDGTEELLIGIMDGASETKFTDIYIWHQDFGALRSFSNGDGYYMYLCDSNVIRNDTWYGSETKTDYMKYNSDENSFPIVDGGGKPGKYDLVEF